MRFRWVPVTSDSVYPFFIGVLEFLLIETLGPDETGLWLLLLATIFAVMVRMSHRTMRRARQDGDNDDFFKTLEPATLRDFIPHVAVVSAMALAGVILWISGDRGVFAALASAGTLGVLVWQFYSAANFWRQTVIEASDS